MLIGNKDVTNPLEVIECIIAFNSKDYSLNYRDRMLYAIVFGWDDESYIKFGWDEKTINEYKELHKRFEELSKLNQKCEWIPVSERLPEEDGQYWITENWGGRRTCLVYFVAKHHISFEEFLEAFEIDAVAWKPAILPEPYKEGE